MLDARYGLWIAVPIRFRAEARGFIVLSCTRLRSRLQVCPRMEGCSYADRAENPIEHMILPGEPALYNDFSDITEIITEVLLL
jgi:hypothetical protein